MASAKPITIEELIAFLEKGGKEVDALNQQYKEHVKKTKAKELVEYKMRGEVEPDYHTAMKLWKKHGLNVTTLCYKRDFPMPDFELTIISDATLEQLIDVLKKGVDLHVMYQSLERKADYTGERKRR